jgi:HSP20 family protein
MDKSSIDIHLENRALKVSAERIQEEEKTEGTTVLSSSRRHGKVTRTVTLPGLVDPKKTEAHYENGVLTITLPKVAGAESGTRIELS